MEPARRIQSELALYLDHFLFHHDFSLLTESEEERERHIEKAAEALGFYEGLGGKEFEQTRRRFKMRHIQFH